MLGIWATLLLLVRSYDAQAQTLTTYSSEADYTAALPTTGLVNKVETFDSVSTYYVVSQVAGDSWSGFTLSATGS